MNEAALWMVSDITPGTWQLRRSILGRSWWKDEITFSCAGLWRGSISRSNRYRCLNNAIAQGEGQPGSCLIA